MKAKNRVNGRVSERGVEMLTTAVSALLGVCMVCEETALLFLKGCQGFFVVVYFAFHLK